MAIGVRILSDNLSGLTADVVFLPQSGGTVNLGTQVFPFNYISEYVYGTYNCYVPLYGYTYTLDILAPTPTPTPTNTPTNTNTPTSTTTQTPTNTSTQTPTNTSTPTPTPTTIVNYYYNSSPICDTISLLVNVVLDDEFCLATTITSDTVLPDGSYWMTDGSTRRLISVSSGLITFSGSCVACA